MCIAGTLPQTTFIDWFSSQHVWWHWRVCIYKLGGYHLSIRLWLLEEYPLINKPWFSKIRGWHYIAIGYQVASFSTIHDYRRLSTTIHDYPWCTAFAISGLKLVTGCLAAKIARELSFETATEKWKRRWWTEETAELNSMAYGCLWMFMVDNGRYNYIYFSENLEKPTETWHGSIQSGWIWSWPHVVTEFWNDGQLIRGIIPIAGYTIAAIFRLYSEFISCNIMYIISCLYIYSYRINIIMYIYIHTHIHQIACYDII